ncbi:hypothetical protein LP420_36150 [Massilia sp. B-10]|nr:hypothetical protein LP420_36150 [Massilia sp. B-10]
MLTSDGTILHHPDPERILVNVHAEPGKPVLKPRWPRSRASRAGPKARPSAGVAALLTYKRLQQTDWIIGAVYPVEEALTPLIAMQRKALLASAGCGRGG